MSNAIRVRLLQGDPIIHDVRNVKFPERYRGLPRIEEGPCPAVCEICRDVCPSQAISLSPLTIDMGKCIFCPRCEVVCPQKRIRFSNDYHTAAESRERLIIGSGIDRLSPHEADRKIRKIFGRSLKLRQISAGGCNGCELELNALSNVNFDMGRYGIEFVASPRHADGVVITGPITKNMAKAVEICYEAVPAPKIIILTGACAISGGVFAHSSQLERKFLDEHKIDLFIPGCPPHPLTFINAVLDWLGRK